MIAIDPAFGSEAFGNSLCTLAETYAEAGIRLPGHSKRVVDVVEVDDLLWQEAVALGESTVSPADR